MSELSRKATLQKQLVASGKVKPEEIEAILKQAWIDLCLSQGLTLKDFSTCRALVDACMGKLPTELQSKLGEWILADLAEAIDQQEQNNVRLFSRRFLSALDCESTRKSLRQSVATLEESGASLLLNYMERALTKLLDVLVRGSDDVDREYLESLRDGERLFDCACRIPSLVATSVKNPRLDEQIQRLMDLTMRLMIQVGHRDVHMLRSAGLAYHNLNALRISPQSIQQMLFGNGQSNNLLSAYSSVVLSALLLGALSCSTANNEEVDSNPVLSKLLNSIEACLAMFASSETSKQEETGGDEKFEKATIACEALCAWCTRAKSCRNCTADFVLKAIKLVLMYMDHRDPSIGSVCSNAFERLVETSLRIENGDQVLSQVFVEQMTSVASVDFASARRGLYPMMSRLVVALGAARVESLCPGFVSTVLNSAFRAGELSSNRPELGNGICNLVVCYIKTSLAQTEYKVTKQIKQELGLISDVLKRGPSNLFASYFVARHLLSDLLGESRSTRENDSVREMAKVMLNSLQTMSLSTSATSSFLSVNNKKKRSLEESQAETSTKTKVAVAAAEEEEAEVLVVNTPLSRDEQDTLLWARLSVMLAFERGGNHVVPVDDSFQLQQPISVENVLASSTTTKKGKKRQLPEFHVEASQLQRAMIHERSDLREVAWALLSTRVKRTKFPEPLLSRLASECLPLIMKHDGSALRPSIIRFIDRIAFCLESGGGGSSGEDEEEPRRCAMEAISSLAATCARSIYPGSPFERLSLALDLSSALMKSFAKSEEYARLISPLLFDAGSVHSLIDTLKSPFDSARMQAYEVLEFIPAPLPGLESIDKIYELLDKYGWRDRLWTHMRRDADSAALFVRLIHGKYVVELGWKLDLFMEEQKSEASLKVEAKLNEEIQANRDAYYMRLAIEEARKCITVPTAYDVGCVIVPPDYSRVLATGFSRELPGNTHAEECALRKLGGDQHLNEDDVAGGNAEGTVLYTTMEPCSLRLSGNRPCASRVVSARVGRVVVGIKEPDTFVQDCQGWKQCQDNGIQVISVPDEQVLAECAVLAKNDHSVQPGFDQAKQMNFIKGLLGQKLNPSLTTSFALNRLVDLLERDTLRLESASKNRTCQEEDEEEIPVHGIIMALKYIVRDSFTCSNTALSLDDLKRVLTVLDRTLTVGVNLLMEIESKERQQVLAMVMDDEDFITKTTTWLLVREGSELLSETLEASLAISGGGLSNRNQQQQQKRRQQQSKKQQLVSMNENNNMEERIQVVNEYCGWFLKTVLRLRHLGAMTYVAKGLERITKLLLQNDDSNLQRIPTLTFVPELLSKLGLDEHDKALRRTEGFALAFRAIARAAQFSNRVDIIHSIVDELLLTANANTKDESHKKLVACLNVLSVIFDDAVLGKSVIPFVAPAIELAVNGFSHSIWAVRNSSLNVFVTVIKRSVGEPDQASFLESSQTQSKSHSTTAKLFFKTHPRLFPFLSRELNDAIQSVGTKQDRPSLHPVLLFLSSLRRSPISSTQDQAGSDDDPALHFVPMLEHLGLVHPNYIIRSLAARALLVLTPPNRIPLEKLIQVVISGSTGAPGCSNSENARHGALLQLKLWLGNASCTFSSSSTQQKDEIQVMLSIQSTLMSFVQNPSTVFLSKQVALDCLEALWMTMTKRLNPKEGATTSGIDQVHVITTIQAKLSFYQSLFEKWIATCSANESDGSNIGRKRFQVSVIHGFVQYACQMGQWDLVAAGIKSVLAPCACEALVNLLSKNVNLSLAPEHASLLLDALFNVLPQLPRDQVHLCVNAIFVVLSQAKSPRLATKERIAVIFSLVKNDVVVTSSLKTRGACIQVLGVCHEHLDRSLFYDLLEENSQQHCPLELRLSCAKSLAEGCLRQQLQDNENVRAWLCALRLLQDADLEVCEYTRIAVAREMSFNDGDSCCLEPILRGAFDLVTNRFALSQIWFRQLVEWIFSEENNQTNLGDDNKEEEEEEEDLLFKADRDNDFIEPTLFAELAGQEMRRVISIRIQQQHQQGDLKTVLSDMAKRASSNLQYCCDALLNNPKSGDVSSSFEAQQTFHARLFCALVAVETFGDSLDVDMLSNLTRIRTQFANKLSFGLKEQLSKCERRFFL